jgi:LuxR family transcriptional regulator, maltose regulon positive regulatory protein
MGTTRPREPSLSPPLLTTKLHAPPGREQAVPRDRLVDRLRAGAEVKLTVVAAPPGCGKTTLLGMWRELEQRSRPVAWVTLDDSDNDPVAVWAYVVEALRGVCPTLDVAVSPQAAGPRRIVELLLPELVNALTAVGEVALVLDDFHRISNRAVHESVAWFVENAPATLQLVLATRNEPALRLAALRAHGTLLELRAEELGFTVDEADLLLNDRLELGIDSDAVQDLVERTEGWAAGVYLAALSLQGVEDRPAFLRTFGGRNRDVVDFLVDEVLEAHDPDLQALMLRSSILDRLSGRLCDAVLDQQGSAERLEALARTNLFLVPLDDRGEWYRFHQLFAQLLQVELEHRAPGLAPTLHRRAAAWHREHGSIAEAINHAADAGAFDEAADMIAGVWFQTLSDGRRITILNWLKRFPPEVVCEDRRLLLVEAWVHAFSGDREKAAGAMATLERLGWRDERPLPDGFGSLEASLATMRAGFPGGDVGEGLRNALRAAELETPESPVWAAVCWALGMCRYYRGDLEGAERSFADTVEAAASREWWLLTASALAYRSLIAGERGERALQRLFAERAATLAQEHGLEEASCDVHVASGESLAARGERDNALPALARGAAVARSFNWPLELADALIRHATLLEEMGRPEAAAAAIGEAKATVDSCADPGILRDRLAALEKRRRVRPRPRDGALTERELVVLRMLGGPLTEREIGRELYLSHNTIHSHTKSIYRKLGVSARSEATQKARKLGLI